MRAAYGDDGRPNAAGGQDCDALAFVELVPERRVPGARGRRQAHVAGVGDRADDVARVVEAAGDDAAWRAAAATTKTGWSVELAVPRTLFPDWTKVTINVTHRRKVDGEYQDWQLCPSYTHFTDGQRIPEVLTSDGTDAFATLEWK